MEKFIFRPFIVTEGLDYTRYHSQIKSEKGKTFYNVETKKTWNFKTKQFDFESFCECKASQFNETCKHIEMLLEKIKLYNENK